MQYEECRILRLLDDGSMVIGLQMGEQTIKLYGVKIAQPLPALYINLITQRIPRAGEPMRCFVRSVDSAGQVYAQLLSYGWQDKSGDVWIDLANILLEEGLVDVADGEFPERDEYLKQKQRAQVLGKGIWAEQ